MKKKHLIILSMLSGILFTAGWPENGFPAFLFLALVPMLLIEQYIAEHPFDFNKFSVLFYTYPGFFLWNFATSYWIWNSTPVAAVAWLLNALFMSIVFQLYHTIRKNVFGIHKGYFLLVVLWITFEFIHLNWKLTWAWLNIGHGFATFPHWIQWYEFTGSLGGTLWVIAVNILLFKAYQSITHKKKLLVNIAMGLGLILIPVFLSQIIYMSITEKDDPINVVITQPNLDPYTEQYSIPPIESAERNLALAQSKMEDGEYFIVAPESALQESIWEDQLHWSKSLTRISKFIDQNPKVSVVIGASTFRRIGEDEEIPRSARYHEKMDFYYDRFNTAFLIDTTKTFQKHHKSKLTPGVEYMPSWGPLSFLENIAIDLGGTVGSLGIDKNPKPFITTGNAVIAPLICYESVYGEFTADFIRQGANVIFVITNDGWWGNTPGHKQHLHFSVLRAIETRRSVARSANTGISCFVNTRGDIMQATDYWEIDVIQQEINLNSANTFYVKHGDYLGRLSSFVSVLLFLIAIVFSIRNSKVQRL